MGDEYRFTRDEASHDGPVWTTPEEEHTFRQLRDVLAELHSRGQGVTLLPVPDGWVVGWYSGNGGGDLAAAPSLDEALAAALTVSRV